MRSKQAIIETLARKLTHDDWDHVRKALAEIEHAQHTIMSAAQSLCPVPGFADEWEAAQKVYDDIKAYWYRVAGRRDRIIDKVRELGLQREAVPHVDR